MGMEIPLGRAAKRMEQATLARCAARRYRSRAGLADAGIVTKQAMAFDQFAKSR
jgi:hypothetical protein